MTQSDNTLVSIIIPVYNSELYLQRCLDSIFEQTYASIEVLVVNDGSVDSTDAILSKNKEEHENIRILNQTNHGQGYARNRALKNARGTYIMFVDSDDYIEKRCVEKAVMSIKQSGADVVHFGWKGIGRSVEDNYNLEVFGTRNELVGAECDEFLRIPNYFSVHNLYKKDFLLKNKIRFGEGYIYEDNEFIVRVANTASKITLLHEQLYCVFFSPISSTRGTVNSKKHLFEYLMVVERCFKLLQPRAIGSASYMASYFLEKFIIYYKQRITRRDRFQFLIKFVSILHGQMLVTLNPPEISKFLKLCIDNKVFLKKRYSLFYLLLIYKLKFAQHIKKTTTNQLL